MTQFYKYQKVFFIGIQNAIAYRANFFMSLMSNIFPVIIQIYLWRAIFANVQGELVYGYTHEQMLIYVILAGIISKFVQSNIHNEVASDIRDGGLNKYIVKPVSYFTYRVCCDLGTKILQLAFVSIIMGIALSVLSMTFGLVIEIKYIPFFVITLFLALFLQILLFFTISVIAFWITEAFAAFMILSLVIQVFSGGIFPLDVFGERFMRFNRLLPFQYITYFPVSVINGKIPLNSIYSGIFVQFIWIIGMIAVAKILWHIGMKKYIAVGG